MCIAINQMVWDGGGGEGAGGGPVAEDWMCVKPIGKVFRKMCSVGCVSCYFFDYGFFSP